MSIEKMYLAHFTGPVKRLDAFVSQHFLYHQVQVIKTSTVLDDVKNVYSFDSFNPYDEAMKAIDKIFVDNQLQMDPLTEEDLKANCQTDIMPYLNELKEERDYLEGKKRTLEEQIQHKTHIKRQLLPIQNLEVEVQELFEFEFMRFRFGRLPKDSYEKLRHYEEKFDVIVQKVSEDEQFIYILYFMPTAIRKSIDHLFTSLMFERIRISEEVIGTPKEALSQVNKEIEQLMLKLHGVNEEIVKYYKDNGRQLSDMYGLIHQMHEVYQVRQYAMRSERAFYVSGWIPASEVKAFVESLKQEKEITYLIDDNLEETKVKPPTKLKNHRLLQPFETLVELYGIPSYTEFDPTLFVAITYVLMFGMMFGDMGQGLLISALGFIIYRITHKNIGWIAGCCGLSSAIFGVIYGSFFGNEEILKVIFPFSPLIHPMEEKEYVLLMAILLGIILIITAMVINIVKQLKNKAYGNLWLDKNGVVGLVLYLALLGLTLNYLIENQWMNQEWLAVGFILVPIVLLFLSHPIKQIIERKKPLIPKEKGSFLIEAFFELFEALLSILSNTVSFVRVGAFALNHVGFFMAFHILGDMLGRTGNLFIFLLGNLLIIGLEGMIVAIQGLRLEYYELFSRFFNGEGIKFQPFHINNNTNRTVRKGGN